jgi:hypothetical protein
MTKERERTFQRESSAVEGEAISLFKKASEERA